jgi:hypothetical protein
MIIRAPITADDVIRLSARPPSVCDLVSASPSVAPKGRVRTYADQKSTAAGILVKKCAAATSASRPAKTSAPFWKPSLVVVATKSPRAVPRVFEIRIVNQ